MKTKITTYWKGTNLGEGRKHFMRKNLRLEPVEPVSVHQIKDYLHSEFVGHALTEHIRNEYQEKLAQAIHDLIYGEEGEG